VESFTANGGPPENALTISQITSIIKKDLEGDPLLSGVRIRGEISNFTHHRSGHMYFSLKDEGAQIRAVMFNRYANTLRFRPEEGLEVFAVGSVSVYEKRGEYQLYITYMQPAGVGALYLQFEKLKKKLAEEGLFDESRKKPLPLFPRKIAVITSPTGAAVRDVINVIKRRFPAIELVVAPAVVQGEQGAESVRLALRRVRRIEDLDLILMVRGGGSIEDLWCFNDEALARDIAACEIPVVSGVGHETDFTIADFVADLRAPTPSAAAEISVPDLRELKFKLESSHGRLNRKLVETSRYMRAKLDLISVSLSAGRMLDLVDRKRQLLDDYSSGMRKSLGHRIERSAALLESLGAKLEAMSPEKVLARGYSIATDNATGRVIKTVSGVKHGKLIKITVSDGDFLARSDLKANSDQTTLGFE